MNRKYAFEIVYKVGKKNLNAIGKSATILLWI